MYLKINDIEHKVTGNETWLELIKRLPDGGRGVLGVSVRGRVHGLTDTVEEYALARTLTYADEEGRRINERSVMLLFLAALKNVSPATEARIEHSFGNGLFIHALSGRLDKVLLDLTESEMRAMVKRDLPIERKTVSRDEAKAIYEAEGFLSHARLLDNTDKIDYRMYTLQGVSEYFYGEMLPSTGMLGGFSLVAYNGGAVLMLPSRADFSVPAPFEDKEGLALIYRESNWWQNALGVENVSQLNEMARKRQLREFVRVNEAMHEHKIAQIAKQFVESGARLLLIAGPSSSGKTTFSHRLQIALRVYGLRPVKLSLDDYYKNKDDIPLQPDGSRDLETPEALDIALINEQLPKLLNGETVDMPLYDFVTGKRKENRQPTTIAAGQPIIIEGIHGMNDALTASVERKLKFKVFISPLTALNLDDHNRIRATDARLLRRIVRDNLFRGTPPEETMSMWGSVRSGETKYIFPYQETADALFDSSLTYELFVMKKYAYPLLRAVQPESPYFSLAERLILFLNYIGAADIEDEIPINSILREFIGGCTFYREVD